MKLHRDSSGRWAAFLTSAVVLLSLLAPEGGGRWPGPFDVVFWNLRVPRVLAVYIAGGLLAAAGTLTQAFFNNPLASPSILGLETAAMLAGALAVTFFHLDVGGALMLIPWIGVAFGWLALFALRRLAGGRSLTHLLLAGFALNTLLGAGISVLMTNLAGGSAAAMRLWAWLGGRFMVPGWREVGALLLPGALGLGLGWRQCRALNVLSLGADTAASLGVNMGQLFLRVAFAIALTCGAVSSVGLVFPFVSLIVPTMVRRSRLAGGHGRVLFLSILYGGSLTLVAEELTHWLGLTEELPPGVLTTVLGVLFFFWLLVRREVAA